MAGTAQRSVRARASQRVVRDLSRPVLSASPLDVGRDLLDAAHRHRLGALGRFVAAPRVVDDGTAHQVLVVLRWLPALLLLWLAVAALFRYAPAERPQTRWASGGSALVVGGWLVASVAFGAWSASVASYKTALGTLTAFLVLTAYTQAVAYVFVLGAQLDETLRRRESGSRASRR